jgi:hypothetical protein
VSLSSEPSGIDGADQVRPPEAGAQAPSGDPALDRVAASVAALDALGDLSLSEQADVYQRVHTGLQGELAEIDGGAVQG